MIGIYLSGTGNSKHCIEKLISLLEENVKCFALTLNDEEMIVNEIKNSDTIFLAYPTQFSNAPYMVREFIKRNKDIWKDKKSFLYDHNGLIFR